MRSEPARPLGHCHVEHQVRFHGPPSNSSHGVRTALRSSVLHQYHVGTSRMNVLRTEDLEQVFPGSCRH